MPEPASLEDALDGIAEGGCEPAADTTTWSGGRL
ncbi:MAG: hypothetical protein JWN00_2546 [Actinomycetia bacterium]|nr:hypothetical protein [Actinomycetes bacterium]